MATKTFKVALSLDNPRLIQTGITVHSFDKQSVKISITLTKDSQAYKIPTGASIKISLFKVNRQEQKIILDVPNNSVDSIDWIVPDYLDGYQGTARCGVYLIDGDESVDLGYFTLNSTVSDIDRNVDDFTEDIWVGWQDIEKDLAEFKAGVSAGGQEVADAKESALVSISNDVQSVGESAAAAKQSALTSIAQATSGVTDATTQFTADLADTQSTIDAQVAQANLDLAEDLAEVDNTIANINEKSTQVDTLHSDFTADVTNRYKAVDASVTQAEQAVNDTVDVFTADITSRYNAFDTSVTQAEQTVNDTADAFTADVTNKYNEFDTHVTQVGQTIDDTVDAFTDDVAIKQADVTSKYNEFDANVRQAGHAIEDILAPIDMNMYYDSYLGEYVNIEWFYQSQKTGKVYTSEFYNYSVSPSSTGVKKDANAGLVAEPSTNEFAGRDDYMDIALFKPLDVNGYVDDNDDYHVTAIKGDGRFRSDGTNGDVWVMNMTGFMKRFETETTWGYSYSDVQHPGFTVVPGGKKIDGTIRPFILRAKYPAVRNPHDDNKLASISGQNPEYVNMSYAGQITEFKKKGAQYSGKTTHDDFWVKLMLMLKYASTNSDTVGRGCSNYFLRYPPTILETGKSRFVTDNSQAGTLVVGSRVSLGNSSSVDRNSALLHNVRNRVMITGIEPLEDGVNSAVYLDTTPFDVTSTMRISTVPWASGACDAIKGVDGSVFNSQNVPMLINGIEIMNGGNEVLQNVLIYNDNTNPDNYEVKAFICYDCTKYATTATEDYKLISKGLVQTNNLKSDLATCEVDPQHPSLMVPTVAGASSTTGFRDGVTTQSSLWGNNYLAWVSLGNLRDSYRGGFWLLDGARELTRSGWDVLGRLSATGRSMGE